MAYRLNGNKILNTMAVKKINESRILELIYWNQGLTQQDIKNELGLSAPTVIQALQQFRELGLIGDGGELVSSGGRKPKTLQFYYDARVAAGVEIRRSHIEAVVIDLKGNVLWSETQEKKFEHVDAYWEWLNQYLKENVVIPYGKEMLLGVGIAFPGEVSPDGTSISRSTVLGIQNMPLANIKQHFDYPVYIEYGANAAGFGAVWSRRGEYDIKDAVYLIVTNNGVAGTVIQDNHIFKGSRGRAAAFGHMTLNPNGRQCFCGAKGCWSAYCGLHNLSDGTDGSLERFFEELDAGKEEARKQWEEYLTYFARALVNIRLSFDLNIIIGGKLAGYLDSRLEELYRKIFSHPTMADEGKFMELDTIEESAQAVGAALIYVEKLLSGEF